MQRICLNHRLQLCQIKTEIVTKFVIIMLRNIGMVKSSDAKEKTMTGSSVALKAVFQRIKN